MRSATITIHPSTGGRARWEFSVKSSNGKLLANGYGYDSVRAAKRGVKALQRATGCFHLVVAQPKPPRIV